ncbi:unnamed protein product, partial [Mesorhabditis belari]|uniref:C2H2-type domain-containing protein n=1 Tax=Mesorhabditis belari TaxID=2138241 RepID=A0AAF3EL90_9BILA
MVAMFSKEKVANGHSETTVSGEWVNEQQSYSISNNTPQMLLKCAECGLGKNSSEELEVHIKQEHLQWLPFQCPICLNERASDAQMREHLYSAHKKNMNKFIYVDNVQAKRNLQILMDRSFNHAMTQGSNPSSTTNSRRGPLGALNGRSNGLMVNNLATQLMAQQVKEQKDNKEIVSINLNGTSDSNSTIRSQSPRNTSFSRKRDHDSALNGNLSIGSSNTDALLAQIEATTGGTGNDDDYDDALGHLAMIFTNSKRMKNEGSNEDDDLRLSSLNDEDCFSGADPSSVLDSLFANVSAVVNGGDNATNDEFHMNTKFGKHSPLMTKKRVLGECSKCQKPVTAGARQMHMFYHLGKDHGIFRFRCKFEGCNIEHYRKDQMENHHSKVHGRIDPEMMEDRSLELYQRCQDLSMELLGTNNCSPGPTAAKAEIAYNAQLVEQKRKHSEKPRRKEGTESTWQSKPIPDDEHPLVCRKCKKTMQNRIRGFHILWHLAKDLNINRYTCKFCDFGHDRSQSVQTHGKREHQNEDCVLDRIDEYDTEIKEMSESCFGIRALFSQESRRRSKIPLASRDVVEESNSRGENSAGGSPSGDDVDEAAGVSVVVEENENEEEPVKTTSSRSAPRRHLSNRRFGMRKAIGQKKRQEMQKLREISLRLGGAQYFKKKVNEAAHCDICGMLQHSRLSEHAYKHLNVPLFVCPHCDLGNYSRETVVKHIKEMHDDGGHPVDQRLKYAQEIKNMIGKCYPSFFVDAPIPTVHDIEKLKSQLGDEMKNAIAADDTDSDGDEGSVDNEDEAQEDDQ